MKTAAKVILDTRRALATGKYPVKIRVRFSKKVNGKTKYFYDYFSAGDEMFEDEFKKLTSRALDERRSKINKILQKAEGILEVKPFISKEDFDYQFNSRGNYESLQGIMSILKDEADKNGQIKTRNLFNTVINSVSNFMGCEVPLVDVDESFLNRYEAWLLEKRKASYNTVGTYSRYIRETWNYAIDKGIISKELYPFGRRKFVPPATIARKIALTEDQLSKLLNYSSEDYYLQRAVDFWKLSFYCFGMNFKDICLLKWGNFETVMNVRVISIFRAKTFGRKRVMKKIEIPVTEQINELIKKYGEISLDPNAYVFKILEPGLTIEQIEDRKNKFIGRTNEKLAEVSDELGIPKVTTYTARHTFAYIMKIRGLSLDQRQELMNHSDQKTTQGYGAGFDIEEKLSAAKLLYL